jgi:D-psicose/D-tagatose/L-ribulose 3-epimerase
VVTYAVEKGVRLGLEPLNRYETSLVNTAEQGYEVVEPLAADGIGLTLDTYHMNIEERNSGDAIRLAGQRLVYIQLCGNDRGAPGGDQVDWDGVGKALVEVGYSGIASIESFTSTNITIATAASIWRALGRTQDDIGRDGLAFLKQWCSLHWGADPNKGT